LKIGGGTVENMSWICCPTVTAVERDTFPIKKVERGVGNMATRRTQGMPHKGRTRWVDSQTATIGLVVMTSKYK